MLAEMSALSSDAGPLDEAAFPFSGSNAEKLAYALNYAVLAPSSHNTQPWHFLVQADSVLVCADRTRALPEIGRASCRERV